MQAVKSWGEEVNSLFFRRMFISSPTRRLTKVVDWIQSWQRSLIGKIFYLQKRIESFPRMRPTTFFAFFSSFHTQKKPREDLYLARLDMQRSFVSPSHFWGKFISTRVKGGFSIATLYSRWRISDIKGCLVSPFALLTLCLKNPSLFSLSEIYEGQKEFLSNFDLSKRNILSTAANCRSFDFSALLQKFFLVIL